MHRDAKRLQMERLDGRELLAGSLFAREAHFGGDVIYPDVRVVEGRLILRTGLPYSSPTGTNSLWTSDGVAAPKRLASFDTKGSLMTYLADSFGHVWYERSTLATSSSSSKGEIVIVNLATGKTRDLQVDGRQFRYLGSASNAAYFRTGLNESFFRYYRSDGRSFKEISRATTPRFESVPDVAVIGEKYAYYDTLKNHVREVWQSAKDGSSRVRVLATKGPVALVPHEGKVLILDQRHTYLLNGKKGAAKPAPGGLKLKPHDDASAASQFTSIGSYLLRLIDNQIHSANLQTGVIKQLLSPAQQQRISSGIDLQGIGSMAYLWQVGRTDGESVNEEFGDARVYAELNDRTFFTDDAGDLYFSQESIKGEIFNDENRNSVRDGGETFSVGRRVFLDQNNDGRWQKREPTDFTDSNGRYAFWDLTGKSVTVRVVPDEDHLDPGTRTVRLDRVGVDRNFALMPAGKIRVSAFLDRDADGRRNDNESAGSWPYTDFWLDLNRNGARDANEPHADSTFAYTFGSLRAGRYRLVARVRTEDLAGFVYTLSTLEFLEVNVTSGPRTREFGVKFVSDGTLPP